LGALPFSNSCRNPAQPTPSPPLASNTSKHRRSNYSFSHSALGHWDLVILWTLGLGHWSFPPSPNQNAQQTTHHKQRTPRPLTPPALLALIIPPMAKAKIHFLCNNCGSVHPKWMGKCPDCGTWDSLEEYKEPAFDERAERSGKLAAEVERGIGSAEPMIIAEIEEADAPRLKSGIGEFDRILGGGVVPGSAILVGGEPGIGKSTLLLQVADSLASTSNKQSQIANLKVSTSPAKKAPPNRHPRITPWSRRQKPPRPR